MPSRCAGRSSCNVIPLTSDTDPEGSIFCQTCSAGHPVPNPSLSSSPTSHIYSATHISASPVGILSPVPLHRVPPLVHVEEPTLCGGRSVTCTAFPHVTLHRQPFPFTRLDAALCITRVTCPA